MTKIATDAGGDVATVMPEISAVAVRSDSASFDSNVEAIRRSTRFSSIATSPGALR